jgi:hypothetical protein
MQFTVQLYCVAAGLSVAVVTTGGGVESTLPSVLESPDTVSVGLDIGELPFDGSLEGSTGGDESEVCAGGASPLFDGSLVGSPASAEDGTINASARAPMAMDAARREGRAMGGHLSAVAAWLCLQRTTVLILVKWFFCKKIFLLSDNRQIRRFLVRTYTRTRVELCSRAWGARSLNRGKEASEWEKAVL